VTVYDATEAPVCSAIVVLGAVPEIDQMVFSAAVMDFIDQFAKTGIIRIRCAHRRPPPSVMTFDMVYGTIYMV
jgi:hypothetical protein